MYVILRLPLVSLLSPMDQRWISSRREQHLYWSDGTMRELVFLVDDCTASALREDISVPKLEVHWSKKKNGTYFFNVIFINS